MEYKSGDRVKVNNDDPHFANQYATVVRVYRRRQSGPWHYELKIDGRADPVSPFDANEFKRVSNAS